MVNLAQRLEALRTERNLSRPALSAQLGFPKGAVEKFETGRQTPSREQQEKLASYFGVSLFYLRGESSDRTRQDDWMDAAPAEEAQYVPRPAPAPKRKSAEEPKALIACAGDSSKQVQELLRSIVLDTLKSPEGQAVVAQAVRKALEKK